MNTHNYAPNRKVYVDVIEERLSSGGVCPRAVTWEDGKRYEVEKMDNPYAW